MKAEWRASSRTLKEFFGNILRKKRPMEIMEELKSCLNQIPAVNLDADDPPTDEEDENENFEEGSDDDDSVSPLAELEKNKNERAEDQSRKEQEEKAEEERIHMENILSGNPLNLTGPSQPQANFKQSGIQLRVFLPPSNLIVLFYGKHQLHSVNVSQCEHCQEPRQRCLPGLPDTCQEMHMEGLSSRAGGKGRQEGLRQLVSATAYTCGLGEVKMKWDIHEGPQKAGEAGHSPLRLSWQGELFLARNHLIDGKLRLFDIIT
ncbi:hypothetical protein GH733_016253 [Mirounga leonina]|nr:hypothetical protein GH733_016253 [Mirounga leonina]